jgi:hypothetical protein
MTRTVRIRPLALIGLSLAVATTFAADDTHRCASVVDDSARLQCYDAAFGKPVGADASGAHSAIPAGTPASESSTPDTSVKARDEFGLSEAEKRTRRQEPEERTESITGQVAQLGRRPTGELVVSLADGQVWSQVESDDSRSRVKVGDTITIRKATLGSYLLIGPDRIAVRVKRVK